MPVAAPVEVLGDMSGVCVPFGAEAHPEFLIFHLLEKKNHFQSSDGPDKSGDILGVDFFVFERLQIILEHGYDADRACVIHLECGEDLAQQLDFFWWIVVENQVLDLHGFRSGPDQMGTGFQGLGICVGELKGSRIRYDGAVEVGGDKRREVDLQLLSQLEGQAGYRRRFRLNPIEIRIVVIGIMMVDIDLEIIIKIIKILVIV